MTFVDGNWKMPNLMEREYYKHIIGKSELKSKLGRFRSGIVIIDVFEMDSGIPPDEILILRSYAYNVPLDKDKFMSDLFKYSLTHNIVEFNPDNAIIYLAKSKNGKTNITTDIMELMLGIMSPKVRGIDSTSLDMI